MYADRRRCTATPVIERIAHREEIRSSDVRSREDLVSFGGSKLQDPILHREDGIAPGDLPFAVRPDTREGVAYLDGAENAAGGTQHDRSIVLDGTFMRRSAQLRPCNLGRLPGQLKKHVQPVRTQVP